MRHVTPAERESFYEQLDRTSHNTHGGVARRALEPLFQIIATGAVDAITSISDADFNTFSANYIAARQAFKDSFRIIGIVGRGSVSVQ